MENGRAIRNGAKIVLGQHSSNGVSDVIQTPRVDCEYVDSYCLYTIKSRPPQKAIEGSNMQRLLISALISISAIVYSSDIFASGKQNFVLLNDTGYTIREVYVSPRKARDWEEDVLGRDQLPNSEFRTITFDRSEKVCAWDLKVVYDDNEEVYWENFDLCTITFILISYDDKKRETNAMWK